MAESTKAQEAPHYGLVLDLPGAAAHPYRVDDYGEFSDEPTPLDETGLSLEEAKELHLAEGVPLALVQRNKSGWRRLPRPKGAEADGQAEDPEE